MNTHEKKSQLPHTPAFLRSRKMMVVLPLLVLPFITLAFWSLGGGSALAENGAEVRNEKGLNLEVPGANLKNDKGLNKMSYYDIAEADSEKFKTRMRNDPYFKLKTAVITDSIGNMSNTVAAPLLPNAPYHNGLNRMASDNTDGMQSGETRVYERLRAINTALNAPAGESRSGSEDVNEGRYAKSGGSSSSSADKENIERLERMMHAMNQPNAGGDSEMTQINAVLQKVLDIQHPERFNEKSKIGSDAGVQTVFSVKPGYGHSKGFFGINDKDTSNLSTSAMEVIIPETQTIVSGSIIKLRLINDIYINNILVPRGYLVFGKVSLEGERLSVAIGSIRSRNSLLPVAMSIYDMDGMEGIYIPGAITRDAAKQSTGNALQSLALTSLDPSIAAQVAGAGIETAKTLISKKVKLVRVTVKAGYHLFLKNNNDK